MLVQPKLNDKNPDILALAYEGSVIASNDYANYFRYRDSFYRVSKTSGEVVKASDELVKFVTLKNRCNNG